MLEKKIKLNRKRPWNCENCLHGSNSFTGSGNPEEVKAVPLLGCWFGLQINYKFIINYEALPLALLSCGLRKRQILKSSEPISILFLASQSHKRSYLQLGDLLFYIPFMYRLISWCSDLWHLNRKDAYKKQMQSRRDPNALPGPWQGQSKKGVYAQQPLLLLCPRKWENVSSPCPWGMWPGSLGWEATHCQGVLQRWVLMAWSLPAASTSSWEVKDSCSMVQIWCTKSQIFRGFSQNHRMVLGWKGPLKSHGQGHLPLVHIVQSLI